MDRIIEYTLPIEYSGRKVSDFLRDKGFSHQNIVELKYSDSGMFIDGKRILTNHIIIPGEVLQIRVMETENSRAIPPVKLPFNVVYEDEDLVVVDKPSGMPIHPSLNNYENTLGNAAMYYYNSQGMEFIYRCINRLDRDTTGLVIIAKNMISANMLSAQHKQGIITKEYTALVSGTDLSSSGTISLPIGRQAGSSIERTIDPENGQEAITHYRVISQSKKRNISLVKLNLLTGRTHQIRVHMKAIGHPLLGDFLYNPEDRTMSRQALHAGTISFVQPITGEKISLRSNVPSDMQAIIDTFD